MNRVDFYTLDGTKPVGRRWMSWTLRAAALYNLIWGAFVVVFPDALFRWAGAEPPNYPQLWQCIGMIVGVYGLGYGIAANDPIRHWPIVLVGFLGKIFGPIGFLQAGLTGAFPWKMGWTILTNDLIWWVPFALILRESYRTHVEEPPATRNPAEIVQLLSEARTQTGMSLAEFAEESRVLVVFLRHMGCTFCRETLGDLARERESIEMSGTQIVLVHMSPDRTAERFLARYGMADVERISDPQRQLYRAFGLRRGALSQVFGWRVWLRGFDAGILHGHGVGKLQGDGFQMPGVFLMTDGQLVRSFRHLNASDRPDYAKISQCGPGAKAEDRRP